MLPVQVTCIAPVNIAVIKYCMKIHIPQKKVPKINKFFIAGGKRNESLILPINDSLSVTLSTADVRYNTQKKPQIRYLFA